MVTFMPLETAESIYSESELLYKSNIITIDVKN